MNFYRKILLQSEYRYLCVQFETYDSFIHNIYSFKLIIFLSKVMTRHGYCETQGKRKIKQVCIFNINPCLFQVINIEQNK